MSRISGQVTVDDEVRPPIANAEPALELPAPPEHLAELAVEALGWSGSTLSPMKLLGRRVVPVAEVIPEAHAERLCVGSSPTVDRAEVATWVWPEMEGRVPPPATRLTGVLAPARHWRSALTAAVPFARFASAAIVLPHAATTGEDFVSNCLIRARQFGIAVLAADKDGVQIELEPRDYTDAPPMEHTSVSRWVSEVLYDHMLESVS